MALEKRLGDGIESVLVIPALSGYGYHDKAFPGFVGDQAKEGNTNIGHREAKNIIGISSAVCSAGRWVPPAKRR